MTLVLIEPSKSVEQRLTDIFTERKPIDICIAFLFSTAFSSIPDFVDYWKHNDELDVPANQPFGIRNITVLTLNPLDEETPLSFDTEDSELIKKFKKRLMGYSDIIRTLMAPSGKSTTIPSIPFTLTESNEHLVMQSQTSWKIRAEANIHIQLGVLFKTMMACKIETVEFPADRPIKIHGLKEEEFEKISREKAAAISAIVGQRGVPGTDMSMQFPQQGNRFGAFKSVRDGKFLYRFEHSGGLKFRIKETYKFKTIPDFLYRLKFFGLHIPKNQVIEIQGKSQADVQHFKATNQAGFTNWSKRMTVQFRNDRILLISPTVVEMIGW